MKHKQIAQIHHVLIQICEYNIIYYTQVSTHRSGVDRISHFILQSITYYTLAKVHDTCSCMQRYAWVNPYHTTKPVARLDIFTKLSYC